MSNVESARYFWSGYYDGTEGNDNVIAVGFGGNIVTHGGDDKIGLGSFEANVYTGDGNDTVNGAVGELCIYDKGGNLAVNGLAAESVIRKYESGNVTYNGSAGFSTIVLRAGDYDEPAPNQWQKLVGQAFSTIVDGVNTAIKAVGDFFDELGYVFKQAFTNVIDSFSSWNSFADTLKSMSGVFVKAWANLDNTINPTKQWVEYSLYDAATNTSSWSKTDAVIAANAHREYNYAYADKVDISGKKIYFGDYEIALPYQYALDKMMYGGAYGADGIWKSASTCTIAGVDYAGVVFRDVSYRVRETSSTLFGAIETNTQTIQSGTRTVAVLFTDREEYYKYKYAETNGIYSGRTSADTAGYNALTHFTPPDDVGKLIATLAAGYLDWLEDGTGSVFEVYARSLYATFNGEEYGKTSEADVIKSLTQNYTYSLQGGASTLIEQFGITFLSQELRQAMVEGFVESDAGFFLREWIANSSGALGGKLAALSHTGFDDGLTHRFDYVDGSDPVGANYADLFKTYMLSEDGVSARKSVHQEAFAGDLRQFTERTGLDLGAALKLMGVSLIDGDPAKAADAVDRLLRAYADDPMLKTVEAWVNAADTAGKTDGPMWRGDDLDELETESGLISLGVRLGGEAWSGNPKYEIYADGVLVASGDVTWAVAASSKTVVDWMDDDSAWRTVRFNVETMPSKVEVRFVNDGWGGNADSDRNLFVDKLYLNADDSDFIEFATKEVQKDGAANASSVTIPRELSAVGVRLGGEAWNGNPQYEIWADGVKVVTGTVDWAVDAGSKTAADLLDEEGAYRTVWFDTGKTPARVEVRLVNDGWGGSADSDRNLFVDRVYTNADKSDFVEFTTKDVETDGSAGASSVTLAETFTMGVRLGGEYAATGNKPKYEIYADGKLMKSGTVSCAVQSDSHKSAADWVGTDSAWQVEWFEVSTRPSQIEVRLTNDISWTSSGTLYDTNLFVDKFYYSSTDTSKYVEFTTKDVNSNGSAAAAKLTVPAASNGNLAIPLLSDEARSALVESVVHESMVDGTGLLLDVLATAQLAYDNVMATGITMGVRLGGEYPAFLGKPTYEIWADGVKLASGTVTWAVAAGGETAEDWLDVPGAMQDVWFKVTSWPSQIEVRFTNDISTNSNALVSNDALDRNLFVDKLYLSTDTSNYIEFTNKNVNSGGSAAAAKLAVPSGPSFLLSAYDAQAGKNMVVNGSFEQSGNPAYGWSHRWSGSTGNMDRNAGSIAGIKAADGNVYYELATSHNATAYQDIATEAGRWYTVSFQSRPQTADAAGNALEFWWEGKLLDTIIEDDGQWRTYTYRVQATDSTSRIAFASGGTSDGIGALVDNVRLSQGIDIIDYVINQALTANSHLGGVIERHWEKHVSNALVDPAAVLAALKAMAVDAPTLEAALEAYGNGYVEGLIEEAAALADDNGQTLAALIAAYGSAAGDASSNRDDANGSTTIDTTTGTDTRYPAGATHGIVKYNGVAGYNKISNEFDYGGIRFTGVAGNNELTQKGIQGDIDFTGVSGSNRIRNLATDEGNITVVGSGMHNYIELSSKKGDIKGVLVGGRTTVQHDVLSGDADLTLGGGKNVISGTGTGDRRIVLGGAGNRYRDDGQSDLDISGYGADTKVTRDGIHNTGSTKALLVGGSNSLSIHNNGRVAADMYSGGNAFAADGCGPVDLLMVGGMNVAAVNNIDDSVDAKMYGGGNIFTADACGPIDLLMAGGKNVATINNSGNIDAILAGGSNTFTVRNNKGPVTAAMYGGKNSFNSDGGEQVDLVMAGGDSVVNIANNTGLVTAEMYGGKTTFTSTGPGFVDLIAAGAYTVINIADGGSRVVAMASYNDIHTGTGHDDITVYGLYSNVYSGGAPDGIKDKVKSYGAYSKIDYGNNTGDAFKTDNSNVSSFVAAANDDDTSSVETPGISSGNRATLKKYGVKDGDMDGPDLSDTGIQVKQTTDDDSDADTDTPFTADEEAAMKQQGIDTDAKKAEIQQRRDSQKASIGSSTADHTAGSVTKNADGSYTANNARLGDADNFDLQRYLGSNLDKAQKAMKSTADDLVGEAKKEYGNATDKVVNYTGKATDTVANYAGKAIDTVSDYTGNAFDTVIKTVGPIVLDTNGNGKLDFIALGNVNRNVENETGVLFDLDGDGKDEAVSWVGKGDESHADSILFYDKDGDASTVTADEMVFARNADETDMQGLAAVYDKDGNSKLEGDELKGFYLWQDNNADGKAGSDEVALASACGITSIGVDTSHTNGAEVIKGNQVYRTNSAAMTSKGRSGEDVSVDITVGDVAFNYVESIDAAGWWRFKDSLDNYDNVFFGFGAANVMSLGSADDAMIALSAYNEIKTGGGNDLMIALGAVNNIDTGEGDDVLVAGGFGNYGNLGAGNDIAVTTGFGNWIDTGTGNDTVIGLGAFGVTPAGANIVRKEGNGNLTAVLTSLANVIYNKGDGDVRCAMAGVGNVLYKNGTGDIRMGVVGILNSISQKGSMAGDLFQVFMGGVLNVSTCIGEGDYMAVLGGICNVSTYVSKSGDAREIVVAGGSINAHSTVGSTKDSKYFLFGNYNILTKVAGDDRGSNTLAVMDGLCNVATLITQGEVTGIYNGMQNIVTRIGSGGNNGGFSGVFIGSLNVATNIANSADAVLMLGVGNVFTKGGNGDSAAIMLGGGNLFTKVGDGNNQVVMAARYGNIFTHVGDGNTLAVLLALNTGPSANIFNKWGDGDTAAMLLANPGSDGEIKSLNVFTQVGNGRTYAMAIGSLNMMIKVGHGDYGAGWGDKVDADNLKKLASDNKADIADKVTGAMDVAVDGMSPLLANRYFNTIMFSYGVNNAMLEINKAALLKGYTDADGKAIDSLTYEEKETSTLQAAIANKGFGNLMVKAGDGLYVNIAISLNDGGDATLARELVQKAQRNFFVGMYVYDEFEEYLETANRLKEHTTIADRAGSIKLTANISVHVGHGDAYFLQYGQNNASIKIGDGADRLFQYGHGNVNVHVGDAADTPTAININGYRLDDIQIMMGTYNVVFHSGISNSFIAATPTIADMGEVNPDEWYSGVNLKMTQADTKMGKAMDGLGLVFLGGTLTYYGKMLDSVKTIPTSWKTLTASKGATKAPKHLENFYKGNASRWTDLRDMWADAMKGVTKSANFVHAGAGCDIVLANGSANIVFGDYWTSLIDISIGSLLTAHWQFVSFASLFSGSTNPIAIKLATALHAMENAAPAGMGGGYVMPYASIGAIFGISYYADGSISDKDFDAAAMGNYFLDMLDFEPTFSFGLLNSGLSTAATAVIDLIAMTADLDRVDEQAKKLFGIGSYAAAMREESLDAYENYADYNMGRILKAPFVVSSFPNLGFLAYVFSDLPDIVSMLWAEASDDVVDYFTKTLGLLTKDGDVIMAKGQANLLFGGHGDDLIVALGAMNKVYGGYDDDIVLCIGNLNAVQGNSGSDILVLIGSNNICYGDGGDDFIFVYGNKNVVGAGAGNNVIMTIGNDTLVKGGAGNDFIFMYGDTNIVAGMGGVNFIVTVGYQNIFYAFGGHDTIINIGNTRTSSAIIMADFDGDLNAGSLIATDDPNDRYYRTSVGARTEYFGGKGGDTVIMLGRGDIVAGGGGEDKFVLAFGARVQSLKTNSNGSLLCGDLAGHGGQKLDVRDIGSWFTFAKDSDDMKITIADQLGLGSASLEIANVYSMLDASGYRCNVVLSYWTTDTDTLKSAWSTASVTGENFTFSYDYMYVSGEDFYDFVKDGRTDWDSIVRYGSASNGTGFLLTHTTSMNTGLSFMGGDEDDTLDGTAGDDVLAGGAGNDHMNGLAGDDTIVGNAGNDSFVASLGDDFIDGGDGYDEVDYSSIASLLGMADSDVIFEVTQSAGSSTVRVLKRADGEQLKFDTLSGVDHLNFSAGQSVDYDTNYAPTFVSDTYMSLYENETFVGTVQASDVNGDSLAYTISGGNDAGWFWINPKSGALSFNKAPNYESPFTAGGSQGSNFYPLTVKVVDSAGGHEVLQTLLVHVMNANDAPVFTVGADVALTVADRQLYVSTLVATDEDKNDTISYSVSGGADQGKFEIKDGVLSFIEAPIYSASRATPYEVTVDANDGNGGMARQTFNINLSNSNIAPAFALASRTVSVAENQKSVTTAGVATDGNNDKLTYEKVAGDDASLFEVDSGTGALSFIGAPNYEKPLDADKDNVYKVLLRASDAYGGVALQRVSVTVTNVNEAPVFTSAASCSVPENMTAVTTVTATDEDSNTTLSYSIVGGENRNLFAIDPDGTLRFIATPAYDASRTSPYRVQVKVEDGAGGSALQDIAVTVTDANFSPKITSASAVSIAENQLVVSTITATDQEGSALSYGIVAGQGDGDLFSIDASGVLSFIHAPDFENPKSKAGGNNYSVTVQVDDGEAGGTTTQTLTVTVTGVNEAPVITMVSAGDNATSGIAVINGTAGNDILEGDDGDNLFIPGSGADIIYGKLGKDTVLLAAHESAGQSAMLGEVGDANGGIAEPMYGLVRPQTVLHDIENLIGTVYDDTLIGNAGANVLEGGGGNDRLIGNGGGDTLYFVKSGDSSIGSDTVWLDEIQSDGDTLLIYGVSPDDVSFRWRDSDLVIEFTDGEDSIAVMYWYEGMRPDSIIVKESASQSFSISANAAEALADAAGNTARLAELRASSWVEVATGTAPVTTVPSVLEGRTVVTTVTAIDYDAGDKLTYGIVQSANDDSDLFTIDPDTGLLKFNTAPDYENPVDRDLDNRYELTVMVTDKEGETDTRQLSVAVVDDTNARLDPVAHIDIFERRKTVTTVVAKPTDEDTLAYSIVGGADKGLFEIDSGTGVLKFRSAPDYENPGDSGADNVYMVTVRAADRFGTLGEQSLTVTVKDLNDALIKIPDLTAHVITGTDGNDTLTGTSADNVILPGAGADTIDGGNGIDTLSYADATEAYYLYLKDAGTGDSYAKPMAAIGVRGGTNTQSKLTSIENLVGTAYDDKLIGNSEDNFLMPGAGKDVVYGFDGNDTVSYAGMTKAYTITLPDSLIGATKGSANASSVRGAEDYLYTIENVVGTDYGDKITGSTAANVIIGGGGNDTLYGKGGGDTYCFTKTASTGFGNDTIGQTGAEDDGDVIAIEASGLSEKDLWFSQNGKDLLIEFVGKDDSIRVQNWFAGTGARIDYIVINQSKAIGITGVKTLVTAMAFVDDAYGNDVTGSTYHGANPNVDNSALAQLVANSWATESASVFG